MRLGLLLGSVLITAAACATGPAASPSVDVTGQWAGTWAYETPGLGSGDIRGSFKQDGAKVSGTFNVTGPVANRVAIINGTVAGNEVKLSTPASGYLTVKGNEMNGLINGLNAAKVTLRKQ